MKFVLCFLLVLCTLLSFGQQEKVGLGIFELGAHPDTIIKKIDRKFKVMSTEVQYFNIFESSTDYYFELIPDTTVTVELIDVFPFSKRKRVLIIGSYIIQGNIKLTNIRLSFCDNKLFLIHCDRNVDIEKLLTSKYGKPKMENEKETVLVKDKAGKMIPKNSLIYRLYWFISRPIACASNYYDRYNEDGEKVINSYFYLADMDKDLMIKPIDRKCKKDIEDRRFNK
jgi:hypothetical protein